MTTRRLAMLPTFLCLAFATAGRALQLPLFVQSADDTTSTEYTTFNHPIRRVAVIGAGPHGLQVTASLLEHGFEVRLFERKKLPGGNWYSSNITALHASFPNRPLENAAYSPDIPSTLPACKIYEDGADGVSNDWRLRDQWNPSPVWDHLTANSPPVITSMPGITYPPDTPWAIPHSVISKNVRQYATLFGLNSNDDEYTDVTSYSTRVEKLYKAPGTNKWTLTLRKLEELPYSGGKLRAEWWTEDFDAVVVATGDYDSPFVPEAHGLSDWAHAHPDKIYHSREYRSPEKLRGKNVLIVGGSVSASEIARDLAPYVKKFSVSLTPNLNQIFKRRSFLRMPPNITHLPRIASYSPLVKSSISGRPLHGLKLLLENGTTVDGDYDEIIFATGYRRSNPFLVGFHNTTIIGDEEPETEVAPIITNGVGTRSLHWTGHYIPDPTLAFTLMRPWTLGRFQALGIAKIWSGKARLPSRARMWETYPGPHKDLYQLGPFVSLAEEATNRLWVTWLNAASLEFGGRLVEPWPIEGREQFIYFAERLWEAGYATSENFTELENTPQSEWPARRNEPISQHFEYLDW